MASEPNQTHRQFDWLLTISWLAVFAFCAACFYMLARLIEWAAT